MLQRQIISFSIFYLLQRAESINIKNREGFFVFTFRVDDSFFGFHYRNLLVDFAQPTFTRCDVLILFQDLLCDSLINPLIFHYLQTLKPIQTALHPAIQQFAFSPTASAQKMVPPFPVMFPQRTSHR
jgi:hypothetical protein